MSFTPFGQHEPLTTRLRGLIREYPRGVGIIKEFIQNADDAGASRVDIVIDWRDHSAERAPESMRSLLGPALLVYNDAVFSDEDVVSIQSIGESVKRAEALKTGRFGLGFNASYNVTDCPSFVTREGVYFLDPHCMYVPGANPSSPGGTRRLADVWAEHPDLLRPFGVLGLEEGQQHFDGTIFRLPLRTEAQALQSEISKERFDRADFERLVALAGEAGAALLLFLKSVLHVRIAEYEASEQGPREVFSLSTQNDGEVRGARGSLNEVIGAGYDPLLDHVRDGDQELPVVSFDHGVRVGVPEGAREERWRVVSGLYRGAEGELADAMEKMHGRGEKAVPWAGVAARYPEGGAVTPVEGRVFCSLPLPQETGLPVHVNGFFDLDSSRQRVFSDRSTLGAAADRASWNYLLVEHGVAPAYAQLLADLAGEVAPSLYGSFYGLWPVDGSESGVFEELAKHVYAGASGAAVVQCQAGSELELVSYGEAQHLPAGWEQVYEPLVADGLALPSPPVPDHIIQGFGSAGLDRREVTPQAVRDRLRDPSSEAALLAEAARECLRRDDWVAALFRFCLSDAPKSDMAGVVLGLREDGLVEPLGGEFSLYYGEPEDLELLPGSGEWLLDRTMAASAGIGPGTPDTVLRPFGLFNLSSLPPLQFIERIEDLCLDEGSRTLREQGGVPSEEWLVRLFNRLADHWAGKGLSASEVAGLHCLPDQDEVLRKPKGEEAPLLPRQNTPKALLEALRKVDIPLVSGSTDFLEAVRRFARAVDGAVMEVEAGALVDALRRSRSVWEGRLDREGAAAILDALSAATPSLEKDEDARAVLADLPLFPTESGSLVGVGEEKVYLPDALGVPPMAGPIRLLSVGESGRWRPLLVALGARPLDLAHIITDVLLPGYEALEAAAQLEALRWMRDHLEQAESGVHERGGDAEGFEEALRESPIVRSDAGELVAPAVLYDPDSRRMVEAVFGDAAAFPDMELYAEEGRRWLKFFARLGMEASPRPDDLIAFVDGLTEEAAVAGGAAVADRTLTLLAHVNDRWDEVEGVRLRSGESLAEALSKRRWLPARGEAPFALFVEPEDRLYAPSELYSPSMAHLVASQHPILAARTLRGEVSDALGLPTQPPRPVVVAHFDALLEAFAGGARFEPDQLGKALRAIYSYFGRYAKDDPQDQRVRRELQDHYRGRPCLWHPDRRAFLKPEHVFTSAQAKAMEPLRAAVKVNGVDNGYYVLGRRATPNAADFAAYLRDLSLLHEGAPLTDEEVARVVKVYAHLAPLMNPGDGEAVPVLASDGRLLDPARVFVPDAPWLEERLALGEVALLHPDVPGVIARAAGVRSLYDSVTMEPVGARRASADPGMLSETERLQDLLTSQEFREGLERLVHHQHGYSRAGEFDWLDRLSLMAVERVEVRLWLDVEGESVDVGSGEANHFFDPDTTTLFLSECPLRLVEQRLAQALNTETDPSLRLRDLSQLQLVLRVEPHGVHALLDELQVRRLRDDVVVEEGAPDVGEVETTAFGEGTAPEEGQGGGSESQTGEGGGATTGASPSCDVAPTGESTGRHRDEQEVVSSGGVGPSGGRPPGTRDAPGAEDADGSGGGARHGGGTDTVGGGGGKEAGSDGAPTSQPRDGETYTSRTGGTRYRRRARSWRGGSGGGAGTGAPTKPGVGRSNGGGRPRRGGRRMVSMVCYPYEERAQLDCRDFGPSGNERNIQIGEAAVQRVIDHETDRGRTPEGQHFYNPGFDVKSKRADGTVERFIEVKGIAGPWGERGVPLSMAQFEFGLEHREQFWLYVVEYAEDPARARVWPIQDPVGAVSQFRFDHRWRALAEADAVQRLEPEPGRRLVVEGRGPFEIVRVQAGSKLRIVYVRADDGTEQRWPFRPDKMDVLPPEGEAGAAQADGTTGGNDG